MFKGTTQCLRALPDLRDGLSEVTICVSESKHHLQGCAALEGLRCPLVLVEGSGFA